MINLNYFAYKKILKRSAFMLNGYKEQYSNSLTIRETELLPGNNQSMVEIPQLIIEKATDLCPIFPLNRGYKESAITYTGDRLYATNNITAGFVELEDARIDEVRILRPALAIIKAAKKNTDANIKLFSIPNERCINRTGWTKNIIQIGNQFICVEQLVMDLTVFNYNTILSRLDNISYHDYLKYVDKNSRYIFKHDDPDTMGAIFDDQYDKEHTKIVEEQFINTYPKIKKRCYFARCNVKPLLKYNKTLTEIGSKFALVAHDAKLCLKAIAMPLHV